MTKQTLRPKDWPIDGMVGTAKVRGWTDPSVTVLKIGGDPLPKKSKYGNTKCCLGELKFDSLRERARYEVLLAMLAAGDISALDRQVVFVLAPAVTIAGRKRPPLRYIADFVYQRDGKSVVEDAKGRITEGYRIKRHLLAAQGISIVEV